MKNYRVLIRRPLFTGCGSLQAELVHFRSKTIAINWAKKKARQFKKDEKCLIQVTELILKKLDMDNILMAFDNEDIIDLVEQQTIKHVINTT